MIDKSNKPSQSPQSSGRAEAAWAALFVLLCVLANFWLDSHQASRQAAAPLPKPLSSTPAPEPSAAPAMPAAADAQDPNSSSEARPSRPDRSERPSRGGSDASDLPYL